MDLSSGFRRLLNAQAGSRTWLSLCFRRCLTSPDSGPCCGTVGIPTGPVRGAGIRRCRCFWELCALELRLVAGSNLTLGFLAMVLVGACTTAFLPTFWALPTEMLTASAAAASIGLINSVGNLGGFAGPYVIGYLRNGNELVHPRPVVRISVNVSRGHTRAEGERWSRLTVAPPILPRSPGAAFSCISDDTEYARRKI